MATKILIIETETYLCQSLANCLLAEGFEVFSAHTLSPSKDAIKYDVVLASASAINRRYDELIAKYRGAIIILMVAYVSDDTVNVPLSRGVTDYIVKPFVMDEIIRKIEHYREFKRTQDAVAFFAHYFEAMSALLGNPPPTTQAPPLLVRASTQRAADVYAMCYAWQRGIELRFINALEWMSTADEFGAWLNAHLAQAKESGQTLYFMGMDDLPKAPQRVLRDFVAKNDALASFISDQKIAFVREVDIRAGVGLELGSEVVSFKEYERLVVEKYQRRYTDSELARRLGISRKSLWERRKKQNMERTR